MILDKGSSIHVRNLRSLATEVFKSIHKLNPKIMWEFFALKNLPYNVRDKQKILTLDKSCWNSFKFASYFHQVLQTLVWNPHLLPALFILCMLRVSEKGRESVVEVNRTAALYGLKFLSNQIAHNYSFEFIFICVFNFCFFLNHNRSFFF